MVSVAFTSRDSVSSGCLVVRAASESFCGFLDLNLALSCVVSQAVTVPSSASRFGNPTQVHVCVPRQGSLHLWWNQRVTGHRSCCLEPFVGPWGKAGGGNKQWTFSTGWEKSQDQPWGSGYEAQHKMQLLCSEDEGETHCFTLHPIWIWGISNAHFS